MFLVTVNLRNVKEQRLIFSLSVYHTPHIDSIEHLLCSFERGGLTRPFMHSNVTSEGIKYTPAFKVSLVPMTLLNAWHPNKSYPSLAPREVG